MGELKGFAHVLPNQKILANTSTLQEAEASSAIENIVTTQDDLYQAVIYPKRRSLASSTLEVVRLRSALLLGYHEMKKYGNILRNNLIIEMYRRLKHRQDGFRVIPGTIIRNHLTGETVHVPPQDKDEIVRMMSSLEAFINDDDQCDLDPLIKMALIHHQFESIHPFHDGNGRIGRILNVLYLAKMGLLDSPILYPSRFINNNRLDYYRLLQEVTNDNNWEDWIVYMLKSIEVSALQTIELIHSMKSLMELYKQRMQQELPRVYSQDLLNNLFHNPYTKLEFVSSDINKSRNTALRYMNKLVEHGFVSKMKFKSGNYYINEELIKLLRNKPYSSSESSMKKA